MNLRKIAKSIRVAARRIQPPKSFSSRKDIIDWLKKVPVNSHIVDDVIDPESGKYIIVSKDPRYGHKGFKLTNYKKYELIKLLSGGNVRKIPEEIEDPRDGLAEWDVDKYYKAISRKNGIYFIYRTDRKLIEEYDCFNIEDADFIDIDLLSDFDAQYYDYSNNELNKFEGQKYIILKPKGLNEENIMDNFEDFFDIKIEPLKNLTEDHIGDYAEYDLDARIPAKITKKDKQPFTKEELEIVEKWLEDNSVGGVTLEVIDSPGAREVIPNVMLNI